ncbi:MAG: hypothetical protein H6709_04905 [Kofleriaceae bacterium]|nr:hypothetical protein [Kofleriaceae bacterium]MCB9571410.1 hypothetical protein [Kofleriaceae bacterium]
MRPPLGLEAGAAWKFQGSATGWDDAAGTDVEHLIAITTTVEAADVVDGRPRWRLHGWPTDAVEHEPGDPEVDTWLLLDGGVMYLATRPAGAPGPRRGEPDDAWLRWPPRDGDEVCPDPDSPYCWRVEAGADDHTYRVIMQTRPDVLAYEIDPARGVLGIEYHHNGTTDDVSLGRVP